MEITPAIGSFSLHPAISDSRYYGHQMGVRYNESRLYLTTVLAAESDMITKVDSLVGSWTRWSWMLLPWVRRLCSRAAAGWTKTKMMDSWRESCFLVWTLKRRTHHVRASLYVAISLFFSYVASHHISTCHTNPVTSLHFTVHHTTSRHVTSHHITWHHTTTRHVAPHHMTSHHTTSHHITSRRITSNHNSSNHASCHFIHHTLLTLWLIGWFSLKKDH